MCWSTRAAHTGPHCAFCLQLTKGHAVQVSTARRCCCHQRTSTFAACPKSRSPKSSSFGRTTTFTRSCRPTALARCALLLPLCYKQLVDLITGNPIDTVSELVFLGALVVLEMVREAVAHRLSVLTDAMRSWSRRPQRLGSEFHCWRRGSLLALSAALLPRCMTVARPTLSSQPRDVIKL